MQIEINSLARSLKQERVSGDESRRLANGLVKEADAFRVEALAKIAFLEQELAKERDP